MEIFYVILLLSLFFEEMEMKRNLQEKLSFHYKQRLFKLYVVGNLCHALINGGIVAIDKEQH